MRRSLLAGFLAFIFAGTALGPTTMSAAPRQVSVTAIRGARIITFDRGTIESGTILIRGSQIADIGADVAVPDGAIVVDATGLTAMPGIVDAEGMAARQFGFFGQQPPQQPMRAELIAGDFFDPYGTDYRPERELRDFIEWGVTAINLKLGDRNVFDGLSSVVKVHAPTTYEDHFVKYRAAVRVNLGESARSPANPPTTATFPTTRMGIAAMVRQEFIDAQAYQSKREGNGSGDDEEAEQRAATDYKMKSLVAALEGEIPVIMHAVEPMDIEAALRIAEEFNLRLILAASSQALEAQAPVLAARNVGVVLGTYFASINSHTGEQTEFKYETAGMLARNGVSTPRTQKVTFNLSV